MRGTRGITLIALIVTIIVLLILAGITINIIVGENGLLGRSETAKEENDKQTATEIMNLKITNVQLMSYEERQELPSLQYLADRLCEDNEIEYVQLESKMASLNKITVGTNDSIYTKLLKYPYEFEINSSFQLASIDNKKVTVLGENVYPANIKNIIETDKKVVFSYTGNVQEYVVPESGYYKIECWGASGGNAGTAIGGKGAYTNGIIYLSKDEVIYVYVGEEGKEGQPAGNEMNGSYNGGGPCGTTNAWGWLSTGGGSTDIRLSNGNWDDFDSLKSRIMVAAGGGGACRMNGTGSWMDVYGGYGGTISGGSGNSAVTNRSRLYKSIRRNSNFRRAFCKQ